MRRCGIVPEVPYPWMLWILPGAVVLLWVRSWWRTLEYRLWFALMAPITAFGGVVLALVLTLMQSRAAARACAGSDCHGVHGFTGAMDDQPGLLDLLGSGAALSLIVALPLTVVTSVVELVRFVRRYEREAKASADS